MSRARARTEAAAPGDHATELSRSRASLQSGCPDPPAPRHRRRDRNRPRPVPTLGDTRAIAERLTKDTGREVALVTSEDRPVPLDYEYRETPLHETVAELIEQGRYPIYMVNFTQRACAEEAQNLLSVDFCTKDEKRALSEAMRDARFATGR